VPTTVEDEETSSWTDIITHLAIMGKGATYIPGTLGHWDVEITVDPPNSWEVVNVIIIEWVKGVTFR